MQDIRAFADQPSRGRKRGGVKQREEREQRAGASRFPSAPWSNRTTPPTGQRTAKVEVRGYFHEGYVPTSAASTIATGLVMTLLTGLIGVVVQVTIHSSSIMTEVAGTLKETLAEEAKEIVTRRVLSYDDHS